MDAKTPFSVSRDGVFAQRRREAKEPQARAEAEDDDDEAVCVGRGRRGTGDNGRPLGPLARRSGEAEALAEAIAGRCPTVGGTGVRAVRGPHRKAWGRAPWLSQEREDLVLCSFCECGRECKSEFVFLLLIPT